MQRLHGEVSNREGSTDEVSSSVLCSVLAIQYQGWICQQESRTQVSYWKNCGVCICVNILCPTRFICSVISTARAKITAQPSSSVGVTFSARQAARLGLFWRENKTRLEGMGLHFKAIYVALLERPSIYENF